MNLNSFDNCEVMLIFNIILIGTGNILTVLKESFKASLHLVQYNTDSKIT
jgi:hypothetical protein